MPFADRTHRMLQMNLRESDFPLDVDRYLREAQAMRAEVLLFNAGGISANYPTRLPFHYQNPRIKNGDPLAAVVDGAHKRGMKVVGRFDFSKVQASLGRAHPEWLYKSLKGRPVLYNGLLHTCLNGRYQQERLFEILDEALSRYPLDGVFINMFGYFTWDYSHNYHGICQCAACRRRFGAKLPRKEEPSDPVFRRYQEFCRLTASELDSRLSSFLKQRHPGCASVSYDYGGADVKCNESNSDTDRALPEWNYSASDNNKRVLGSFRGMHSCNAAISFAGHASRHVGVSPHLNALRLAGDQLNGGWPWFVVIGPTWKQADRSSLALARESFSFHQENLAWLGRSESRAELALVACGGNAYKGLFRALSEAQLAFDCVEEFRLDAPDLPRALSTYKALIVPEVSELSPSSRRALDAYVKGGGRLVAAGFGGQGLASLGVASHGKVWERQAGRYLMIRTADKKHLKGLADYDLLYLDTPLQTFKAKPGCKAMLRLIPQTLFGPPEKCEPGPESEVAAAFLTRRTAYFPYSLGAHHEPRHFAGHARLFLAALGALKARPTRLKVEAHPLLEVSHRAAPDQSFEWAGLLNHSGQNGSTFHAPLPLRGVRISLAPLKPWKKARLLKQGLALKLKRRAGRLECVVPQVDLFDVVLFEN